MQFTAYITGNRRDISSQPKILLTHISNFRDHCWVVATDHLSDFQPHGHHKPKLVSFTADIIPYRKQGVTISTTLTNIQGIHYVRTPITTT